MKRSNRLESINIARTRIVCTHRISYTVHRFSVIKRKRIRNTSEKVDQARDSQREEERERGRGKDRDMRLNNGIAMK